MKSRVEINERYRKRLTAVGLATAADFLQLPGPIISGHVNRNVARVEVDGLRGILKRAHRVAWRERLANALTGFGWISNCARESLILAAARSKGIVVPETIAVGDDGRGRAFLLVREFDGYVDLRQFAQDSRNGTGHDRKAFARALGVALAQIHQAGLTHPDLYAKHIYVHPVTRAIGFIDWQRSVVRATTTWKSRYRDLAALNATLAAHLAAPRERLRCLASYLRHVSSHSRSDSLRRAAKAIARRTQRLWCQRRIREQHCPDPANAAALVWMDGEALSVTPAFRDAVAGEFPSWLLRWEERAADLNGTYQTNVQTAPGREATMMLRGGSALASAFWGWIRGRRPTSPELQCAALTFRLERFGVSVPKVLAVGQRHQFPGTSASFLLTESEQPGPALEDWLVDPLKQGPACEGLRARREIIRQAGRLMRRIHEAGCRVHWSEDRVFVVHADRNRVPRVRLARVQCVEAMRKDSHRDAITDVKRLQGRLAIADASRTDLLRFLLAYLDEEHLPESARRRTRALWLDSHRTVARFQTAA
jgi:tRNA A-37 threonylcarbamoyl transferase component Bud32